jgi:hypothetical protein
MTSVEKSIAGAKESRAIIKQFHACLNSLELIPEQSFRRNSGTYPLVCYVNNIIGLFLSKNYEPISVFIARASEHMANHPPSAASTGYYRVVNGYLSQITYHLRHFVEGIEYWDARIPSTILEAGPQELPCTAKTSDV